MGDCLNGFIIQKGQIWYFVGVGVNDCGIGEFVNVIWFDLGDSFGFSVGIVKVFVCICGKVVKLFEIIGQVIDECFFVGQWINLINGCVCVVVIGIQNYVIEGVVWCCCDIVVNNKFVC